MKTPSSPPSILRSPLRSLSVALLLVGALSSTASAEVVATYWSSEQTSPVPLPAHDYLDGVLASNLDGHGTITNKGSVGHFSGWTNSLQDPGYPNYVGFTIEAEEGFQMTLTSLEVSTAVVRRAGVNDPITAYLWGYRVDDGAGYGAWVFNPKTYTPADGTNFWFSGRDKNWDFADFTTTGKVEFGLFGSASGPAINGDPAQIQFSGNPLNVNGSVSAVPEPSTYALIIIAGLAFMVVARRRRYHANA